MEGAFPDLVVIGAQKCGTTALHVHLTVHPEIGMSRQKELGHFRAPPGPGRDGAWYRSWFDPAKAVRGESSPVCTHPPTDPEVAERMHAVIPDARLVCQLERFLPFHPLERILVMEQEALLHDRHATLAGVFRWLGVDPAFRSVRFQRHPHRTVRKKRLTGLLDALRSRFADDVGRLQEWTGQAFERWSV